MAFGGSQTVPWRRACLAALALAVAIGCTSVDRHRWLTVFFDGVPPLDGEATTQTVVLSPGRLSGLTQTVLYRVEPPAAVLSAHEPHTLRQCDKCHVKNDPAELVADVDDLCLVCHQKEVDKKAWNHGPVEIGMCASCHVAHRSLLPSLLIKRDDTLCLECHERGDLPENERHVEAQKLQCLECHDPHTTKILQVETPVSIDEGPAEAAAVGKTAPPTGPYLAKAIDRARRIR